MMRDPILIVMLQYSSTGCICSEYEEMNQIHHIPYFYVQEMVMWTRQLSKYKNFSL